MKFAHLGDCHLGGWRQPELQKLNLQHFEYVVDFCIKKKMDFVLIAGDLFDSAYPPIDTIKEAFNEFRKLKEADIPVFLIAGSHDYSTSGKTFLDVLEKAGFAKNVFKPQEKDESIILHPTIYKDVAIYGYPGKKSGIEVQEIARVKLNDHPSLYKILMLHTALRDAVGTLPIPAVDETKLPVVDYTALAHLHIKYNANNRVYCGPTFPNNSLELEELKCGSFYFVDTETKKIQREEIKLKDIVVVNIEITNTLTSTDEILSILKNYNLKDKIVILKIKGILDVGKISDINFFKIEDFVKMQGAYVLLKNTKKLQMKETEVSFELSSENIEEEILLRFKQDNPNKFNLLINELISILQLEKKEEEKSQIFEDRLMSEISKSIKI